MTNNRVCTECKGSDEVRLAKADGTSDGVECSKRSTKDSDEAEGSKVLSEVEGR